MAIIIPSKSIYQKDNPKVRDNIIDYIEVVAKEVVPNNEYDTSVYNGKIENIENALYYGEGQTPSFNAYFMNLDYQQYVGSVAFAYFEGHKYIDIQIKIPVVKNNKYISKISQGLDDDNNAKIKYNIYGNIEEGTSKVNFSTITWNEIYNTVYQFVTSQGFSIELNSVDKVTFDTNYSISKNIEIESEGSVGGYRAKATTTLISQENVGDKQIFTLSEDGEYYVGKLKILCEITEYSGNEIFDNQGDYNDKVLTNIGNISIISNYKKYYPKQIEITIYGNTIGIDLQDKTIYVPNEKGTKPYSIQGNEIMQTSNYYTVDNNSEIVYNTNQIVYNTNKIVEEYKNGKETATIRCSINEYYDQDGNLAISTKLNDLPMIFEIGDLVIPYVYNSKGEDEPMSKYQNGKPKVFRVCGTKPLRRGVAFQELYLQEVKQN